MSDSYPSRESHFAHRATRLLLKSCAVQDIGHHAAMLVVHIAHAEDAARYQGAVRFWNSQLMETLGFRSPKQLNNARKKAVDAGWLHYERDGAQTRGIGRYWVKLPTYVQQLGDYPTEPIHSVSGTNNGMNSGTNQGGILSDNGTQSGTQSGKLSNPNPNPKPSCGVATPPAKKPPAKTSQQQDATFEKFWSAYPTRDGRKREKAKAVAQWKRLSAADRDAATRAAPIYSRGEKFIKDAFRWLRDRSFEDWLTPAEPEPPPRVRIPETAEDFAAAGYTLIED